MNLDCWKRNRFDHVVKRDAREAVPCRVDDGAVDIIDVRLKCIDQDSLVVGLLDDDFNSKFTRYGQEFFIDEFERLFTVNLGLTPSKEIRVRPMQDEKSKPSAPVARLSISVHSGHPINKERNSQRFNGVVTVSKRFWIVSVRIRAA